MDILVVEDDENKRVQLKTFLEEFAPGTKTRLAKSLQSGVRCLREQLSDLVILDMTLPNFDAGPDEPGGQIHPLGGRELLEQMLRFQIEVPVVVVTQFETFGKGSRQMNLRALHEQLQREYGHIYKGAVYYHAAIHGWKESLGSLIESLSALLKLPWAWESFEKAGDSTTYQRGRYNRGASAKTVIAPWNLHEASLAFGWRIARLWLACRRRLRLSARQVRRESDRRT
jgi:CheY-like chemotaxis protein